MVGNGRERGGGEWERGNRKRCTSFSDIVCYSKTGLMYRVYQCVAADLRRPTFEHGIELDRKRERERRVGTRKRSNKNRCASF